jgi:hypothetical protein
MAQKYTKRREEQCERRLCDIDMEYSENDSIHYLNHAAGNSSKRLDKYM